LQVSAALPEARPHEPSAGALSGRSAVSRRKEHANAARDLLVTLSAEAQAGIRLLQLEGTRQ